MTGRPTSPSLADSSPATKSSAVCPDQTEDTTQGTWSNLVLRTGEEAQDRRKLGSRTPTWPLPSDLQTQSRRALVAEEEEEQEEEGEEEDEEDKSHEGHHTLAMRPRSNTVPLTEQATEELRKASVASTSAQQSQTGICAQQADPLSTTDIRDFAFDKEAVDETKKARTKSRKKGRIRRRGISVIEHATQWWS